MNSCIHNTLLFIVFTITLETASSLQREKRIASEDSNPRPSHILRSPFQPPDENGNTINFQENHLRGSNVNPSVPKRSPFSPPGTDQGHPTQIQIQLAPSSDKSKSPSRIQRQNNRPTKVKVSVPDVDNKSPFQRQVTKEFRNPGPVESSKQSRKGSVNPQTGRAKGRRPSAELEQIMERQRHNSRAIPSISDIQVESGQHRQQQQQQQRQPRRQRQQQQQTSKAVRPRHTAFQNRPNVNRDMHDVGPGVTPWTRYTDRPRNAGRGRKTNTSSYRGRCGRLQYSPRNQICCQGRVLRRQGIQPSCCQANTYDAVYKKCCNGNIVMLTDQTPGC